MCDSLLNIQSVTLSLCLISFGILKWNIIFNVKMYSSFTEMKDFTDENSDPIPSASSCLGQVLQIFCWRKNGHPLFRRKFSFLHLLKIIIQIFFLLQTPILCLPKLGRVNLTILARDSIKGEITKYLQGR
jgi:hypothetical protein